MAAFTFTFPDPKVTVEVHFKHKMAQGQRNKWSEQNCRLASWNSSTFELWYTFGKYTTENKLDTSAPNILNIISSHYKNSQEHLNGG